MSAALRERARSIKHVASDLLLSLGWQLLLRLRQLLDGDGVRRAALITNGGGGSRQHAERVPEQGFHLIAIRRQRLRDDAAHSLSI